MDKDSITASNIASMTTNVSGKGKSVLNDSEVCAIRNGIYMLSGIGMEHSVKLLEQVIERLGPN